MLHNASLSYLMESSWCKLVLVKDDCPSGRGKLQQLHGQRALTKGIKNYQVLVNEQIRRQLTMARHDKQARKA
jgi:hypothetical protein